MFNLNNLNFDLNNLIIENSIYHRRCQDITNRLKKYDVKAEVSRRTFNNIKYYVCKVDLKGDNLAFTVAEALGIKFNDVHSIHIDLNGDYKIFWINEDLINDKYLTHDGRLCFNREEYMENKAQRLICDDNTVCTNIWNNPSDIIIKLVKKS